MNEDSHDEDLDETFPNKKFFTVRQLLKLGVRVGDIATAVEKEGFQTWDRYGRFIKVPALEDTADSDLADMQKRLLDDLAQCYKEGVDALPKGSESKDTILRQIFEDLFPAGWRRADLPAFEKLGMEWHKHHVGDADVPELPEPASQSKVWDVLKGLLMIKYEDKVIDDLTGTYSKQAQSICDALESKGVKVSPKVLKQYVKRSLK